MTVTPVEISIDEATVWLTDWIHHRLGIHSDLLAPSSELRDLAMDSTETLLLIEDIRSEFDVCLRPMALASSSLEKLGRVIADSTAAASR